MKKNVVFFLTVLLFLSPVFAGPGSSEGAETFLLMEKSPIGLSFENYQVRDGWTPVVLSVGEFNCLLWMDDACRVSELRETDAHFVEPVCVIDELTQSLQNGANILYFDVYEHNSVRTRWRLSPGETAGTMPKKILFREHGIELYLGNLRLKLNHVDWDFRELSPGLFQVKFYGPMVLGCGELVVDKAKGIIYSTHGWNNRLTIEQSLTWSMNPNRPASGSIPPLERAALIALYNSTAGDNWRNKSGWKTPPLAADGFALPGTENTWYGIGCDPGNITVQSISLFENNLNGGLPPELANLVNLQFICLEFNQLSGSISPELGNLANMKWFSLAFNQFRGSIPPELANMTNLQYLFLDGNQLRGSIPPELGNLANLQGLYLELNQLSGSIPPELGSLANLQYFYFDVNRLSGSIPPELGNLANLKSLGFLSNQLSGSIPPELGNLANLKHLYFSSNQLIGSIPSNLTNLTNLVNGSSDFKWNALYTNDDILRKFLDSKEYDGDWESTQTIAPSDVTATVVSTSSIDIHWTPITYTSAPGGYRVFYSTTPGGPYTYFGMTADKSASSLTVTGLNPGPTYYFVVQTRTNPHLENHNTVDSEYSVEVSASTLQRWISGSVTCGGKGLQGVNIDDSEGRTTLTDSNGNYSMKVSYGWFGIVTPSMTGYIFSPANRSYANVTDNQIHQDYIAVLQTFTISGTVKIYGKGLRRVTIALSNGPTTLTDGNGNYKVTVSYGWSGKVTPSMAGFIFSPPNRSYTNVTSNKSNQNFEASLIKSLSLTSPNGGELWSVGTMHNITWTCSGLSGNIRLELWKANKKVSNIAVNTPIANCNYPWLIGQYSSGSLPTGNDYKVKIITANGLYNDTSDGSFSIVRSSLKLTSPQDGEN